MPDSIWNAFFAISAVGAVIGLLCGAELVSGLALAIFMVVALIVFVIWTIVMLDPQGLAEEPAYKDEGSNRRQRS